MAWRNNWSRNYAFNFYQKATMLLYFSVLGLLWGPLAALYFLSSSQSKSLMALASGTAALSIAASWFFSRLTAHYMVHEEMGFRKAAAHTFYPVLSRLAAVPVLGALFLPFLRCGANDDAPSEVATDHSADASTPGDATPISSRNSDAWKNTAISSKRVER
jgi:hypothetical protein